MEEKQILESLQTDLARFISKHDEEVKSLGAANKETVTMALKLQAQLDAIDAKMQAVRQGGEPVKSIAQELDESEDFKRLKRDGRGTARIFVKGGLPELQRKTTISEAAVGSGVAGVLMPEMDRRFVVLPQVKLTMRDILPSAPTSANAVFYVKENAFTNSASPQLETSPKGESAITYTTVSATVQTLAHWIPASKQVLDDFEGLTGYIRNKLIYGLKKVEESQILSGAGTGTDLDGLITQGTAFDTTLLSATKGWSKIDILRRLIEQNEAANVLPPDFIVVNPVDWADIELTKDSYGRYVVGDPAAGALAPRIWGKNVVVSNNITSGTFLAGVSQEATIRDRMEAVVEISTEYSDYFVRNMVAIRCEERLTLVCYRPLAFLHGSFTTSPA